MIAHAEKNESSTIAAIATPPGSGGIGIIKISGSNALKIAKKIFLSKEKKPANFSDLKSHRIYYGNIVNPHTGEFCDEVLLTVMKAPNTYTKEDVVEINTHAGTFVMGKTMDIVLKQGAVLAEPGEFTKRAFLNGRIDLTQAEAVADIINAKNRRALNAAISQVKGTLKRTFEELRERTIHIMAKIEGNIDFPEDIEEFENREELIKEVQEKIEKKVRDLIGTHEKEGYIREGIRLVIAGGPNAGKSTLMNTLLSKERSIVSTIPGTTRDMVEGEINICGATIIITDTAGIRNTNEHIENLGIKKTWEAIDDSDIILYVIDGTKGIKNEDLEVLESIENKKVIIVINKLDVMKKEVTAEMPDRLKNYKTVKISALQKKGIEKLQEEVVGAAIFSKNGRESKNIPNLRHRTVLERTKKSLEAMLNGFKKGAPSELIAIDTKEVIDGFDELLGNTKKVDILDNIFEKFCIGK